MAIEPGTRAALSWPRIVGLIVLGAFICGSALIGFQFLRSQSVGLAGAPSSGNSSGYIAEADFQIDAAEDIADPSVLAEWRAARSDHKIIALSIANCEGYDADVMPRNVFSALRLDLRPGGNYSVGAGYLASQIPTYAEAGSGRTPGDGVQQAVASTTTTGPRAPERISKRIQLAGYDEMMLMLSDAAARARISAADGTSSNYPQVKLFGWYTVLISGLATLLITLKSSMNPRPRTPDAKSIWHDFQAWRNGFIVFLGIAAIVSSTAGTVLNGVKQFYDPTSAYLRNTDALVKARKLQQEIALSFISVKGQSECGLISPKEEQRNQVSAWTDRLADLQQQILKAAVPLPGDAVNTPKAATTTSSGSDNPKQPVEAPPPAVQPAGARPPGAPPLPNRQPTQSR